MGVNAIAFDGVGMGLTATSSVRGEGVVVGTSTLGLGDVSVDALRAAVAKTDASAGNSVNSVEMVAIGRGCARMGVARKLTHSKGRATRGAAMGVGPSSRSRRSIGTTSLTDRVGATSANNKEVPKVGRGDVPCTVRPGDRYAVTEGPSSGDRINRPRPHDDTPHREGTVQGGLIGSYSTRQVGEGGLDGALNEPDVVISLGHRISRNWIGSY